MNIGDIAIYPFEDVLYIFEIEKTDAGLGGICFKAVPGSVMIVGYPVSEKEEPMLPASSDVQGNLVLLKEKCVEVVEGSKFMEQYQNLKGV